MPARIYITPRHQGFTLIEVLVAMVIFVLLAVMSYGGLMTVLNAEERFNHHNDRLAELQMMFMLMNRDFEQAVNRPVRDAYGDPVAAFVGDADGVEMTRAGRRNPGGLLRSQLQRIAWRIVDDQLSRASWAVLDRAPDTEAVQTSLLDNIETINFRFLSAQGEWFTEWPLLNEDDKDQVLPQALEVKLGLADWGEITRLFRITTDRPRSKGNPT